MSACREMCIDILLAAVYNKDVGRNKPRYERNSRGGISCPRREREMYDTPVLLLLADRQPRL